MEKLITPELLCFDLDATTKEEVINKLADKMDAAGRLNDKTGYVTDVLAREQHFSTAVGFSVATPHAKTDHAKTTSIAFARLKNEIVWDDEDETASLIFQLAVPTSEKGDRHLQILAKLSRKLLHDDFRAQLIAAKTPEEVIELVGEV